MVMVWNSLVSLPVCSVFIILVSEVWQARALPVAPAPLMSSSFSTKKNGYHGTIMKIVAVAARILNLGENVTRCLIATST